MPETSSAYITIGGTIPESVALNLANLIHKTICDVDNDTTGSTDAVLQAIREPGTVGRVAMFADDEAIDGMFREVETFCVKNGIPFVRYTDAAEDCNAHAVWFAPGGEPRTVPTVEDGHPVVPLAELVKAGVEGIGDLISTYAIPDLPPLVIVPDVAPIATPDVAPAGATRIVVSVRGGVIEDVYCSDPGAQVQIIDFDDGEDEGKTSDEMEAELKEAAAGLAAVA